MRYLLFLPTLAVLTSCGQLAATEQSVAGYPPAANPDTVFFSSTQQLRSDTIPNQVFAMTQLRHLSISGMDCDYQGGPPCWALRDIPPGIANLQQLRTLSLTVNSIRRLPSALGQLPHLRSLDLTDNPGLSDIEAVVHVASLEELTLYGCGLSQLPADIGQLTKLRKLGLIGNSFAPPEQARIRKALPRCKVSF